MSPLHLEPQATNSVGDLQIKSDPAILRLAILHLSLDRICLGGRDFDESASQTELSEHILYYGRRKTSQLSSFEWDLVEALQFAGLCAALYSLPESIDTNGNKSSSSAEDEDNKTEIVHLSDSLLVFVPLEDPSLKLIAVVEVNRRRDVEERLTASAVKSILTESHRLFCLRRGGVHPRLRGLYELNTDYSFASSSCIYPGMDVLYATRKASRKDSNTALPEDPKKLPIVDLKRDLEIHYNDFLVNALTILGHCRFSGRSVANESHPLPSNPFSQNILPMDESTSAGVGSIQQTFANFINQQNDTLIALSLWAYGNFVATRTRRGFPVTNADACTMLSFMLGMQEKGDARDKHSTKPGHLRRSGIAAPPPLSLLGSNDASDDFEAFSGHRAWLPRVYLECEAVSPYFCRVGLVQHGNLQLLVWLRASENAVDRDCYPRILEDCSLLLKDMIFQPVPFSQREGSQRLRPPKQYNGRGQTVLIVDHGSQLTTVVYSSDTGKEPQSMDNLDTGILRLTDRIRRIGSSRRASGGLSETSFPITSGRQKFSSLLQLSSVLAFDDSLARAESFRKLDRWESLESCTALKDCWMYTLLSKDVELHALFDPKVHVTIADVQVAVEHIKCHLLRGHSSM